MDTTVPSESAKVPSDLWNRLRAWRAGPEGLAFVDRLDDKLQLKSGNASRLADEYIRFLALAVTGRGTTVPSRIIDEAWHLHLLDTRTWFDRFCPDVLGRTLHHEPGRPPPWRDPGYETTRERYTSAFGNPPPADIWPDAKGHFRLRLFGWLFTVTGVMFAMIFLAHIVGREDLAKIMFYATVFSFGATAILSMALPMRSSEKSDGDGCGGCGG